MRWSLARITAAATGLWGLLWASAGIGHSVAVWATAYSERGGFDKRLATLLAIGWTMIAVGAILGSCSRRMWSASRAAYNMAAIALVFLLVFASLLAFNAGPIGIGGTIVLLGLVLVARRSTMPS